MDAAQTFLIKRNEAADLENEAEVIPPVLYRIYKSTVQRQVPNYLAFSSHAAYLVLLDSESQVLGWIGSQCDEEDVNLLNELGIEVMTRDYRHVNVKNIPIVHEQDDPGSPLLEAFLDIFDIDSSLYVNKLTITERRKPIENSSVSVGLLVPPKNLKEIHLFELKETSYAHPDVNGTVPRIPFPTLTKDSIVYMNIGDQWDLWFSKQIPSALMDLSIKFIENLIETQLSRTVGASLGANANEASIKSLVVQYLQITNQGQERQCFRRPLKIFTDFEPFDSVQSILAQRTEEKEREEKEAAKQFGGLTLPPNKGTGITRQGINNQSLSAKMGIDMSPVIPKTATFWSSNTSSTGGMGKSDYPVKKGNNPMVYGNENQTGNHPPPPQNLLTIPANDVEAVTSDLLEFVDSWNISLHERRALLQNAATNPEILLGWQVEIDDGLYSGLFVVVGTKKSTFRKTFFHLCAGGQDEFWIRLKRGDHKNGVPFRPLRKVANIEGHAASGGSGARGGGGSSSGYADQQGSYLDDENENEGELALRQTAVHLKG